MPKGGAADKKDAWPLPVGPLRACFCAVLRSLHPLPKQPRLWPLERERAASGWEEDELMAGAVCAAHVQMCKKMDGTITTTMTGRRRTELQEPSCFKSRQAVR